MFGNERALPWSGGETIQANEATIPIYLGMGDRSGIPRTDRGRGASVRVALIVDPSQVDSVAGMSIAARASRNLSTMFRDAWVGIVNAPAFPKAWRAGAWRRIGHTIGDSVRLAPGTFLGSRRGLTIGNGSFVNYQCFFDLSAPITIGQNCDIGFHVRFVTSSHEVGPHEKRAGAASNAPILVGDGVWIGAGAMILPGVSIGAGSVIGAGAVVTKDCEADTFYAGVPAQKVRSL